MNILFLSTIFPDALHPARGTFNFELCSALKRAGTDVKVICPQAWPELFKSRTSGKSPEPTDSLRRSGLQVEYPTYWYPPKIARSSYGSFYTHSVKGTVSRLLKNWQPDLILTYWAHPDGYAGLKLAEQYGTPAGVLVGGSDVLLLPKSRSRKKQVERVVTESDVVLTVSEGLARKVEELGAAPERVVPLFQGVDASRFKPGERTTARQWLGMDPNRSLLIWVGRMVPVKNLDLLINAAEIKANRGDDFLLCLLGDGPERERIAKLIRDKGLEDMISIVGSVGHEELPTWYQAADAVLLSSHSEGLPNVLREALACGTPFVSTDVGSISEISHEDYSVLVPAGDEKAFANAIDTVLHGEHHARAVQANVRTWDDTAGDLLDISAALISGNSPGISQ